MINLGIIGLSEGNGHPYSWSAIFNGYDKEAMKACPFPIIYEYLEQQSFPKDNIHNAKVTHIWTQDKKISHDIAKSSLIPNVVDKISDMNGKVDAILLARDDAENHIKHVSQIIDWGLPIYVDKPLALNIQDAKALLNMQQYDWQVFSCSALRYAKELSISKQTLQEIGKIKTIHSSTPKSWNKYAVHIIEPTLRWIDNNATPKLFSVNQNNEEVFLSVTWSNEVVTNFHTHQDTSKGISFEITGTNGTISIIFKDTFYAFKNALVTFISGITQQQMMITRDETMKVVKIISMGIKK